MGGRPSPATSDCVKNVILSEAKDLKWPKNQILRYTQKFARVTHTTINESIIVKYRSFASQANPVRLRMTKMWGFHSNDKKREKCFFTQSDIPGRQKLNQRCVDICNPIYYNEINQIRTLIKRGGGKGPAKPRQPSNMSV